MTFDAETVARWRREVEEMREKLFAEPEEDWSLPGEMKRTPYTEEEDEYIRQNFRRLGDAKLGEHLWRSASSVQHRRVAIGCLRRAVKAYTKWTAEEERYIVDNWDKLSPREMARALGKTVKQVNNKKRNMRSRRKHG